MIINSEMSFSVPKVPQDRNPERLKRSHEPPLKRSFNNSFIVESPIQNDENERNKRRSKAHLQRSISNAVSTPTVGEHPPAAEHEIKNHIDICMKMFMENKITSKNAWNIKIIDYMSTFLQSNRGHRDSLQVGSTSLDVGAKVYAIRVDDVHSMGLKLASNMSKVAQQQQKNESEDEEEHTENANKTKKLTKKKKKFATGGVKHTIAKDVNALLCDVPKLDSAYFQTKSNAELSMLDNFLTNRIPMDKSGCMFTLMNKERMWTTKDDTDHSLRDKTYNLKIPTVDKMNICPDFCNFEVDVWDPDNDEREHYANNALNNTELVFDDNGIPIAELDGSVHDIFNEPNADYGSSEEDQEPERIAVLGDVMNITDLRPNDTLQSSDYAYQSIGENSRFMSNIWAGPSHWKFKHIKRASSKFSGVVERKVQQKKRPRDKSMVIDYMDEKIVMDENESVTKKKILLKPWPETNKFCIRVSHSRIMKTMQSLLMKPAITAYGSKYSEKANNDNNNNENDNFEVSPYNYENPNDSFYCPAQSMGNDEEEIVVAGQNQAYTAENLIDLPEMVQTNTIAYATRAKKMDMKKLKGAVWKILIDDTENDLVTKDMFEKQVKNSTMFSVVYNKLPTILNRSMKEELSSPLAFVAMLHLANEQNLQLTGQADLADFKIEGAIQP